MGLSTVDEALTDNGPNFVSDAFENWELRRANEILKSASLDSTGQCNSASSLAAGVSKPSLSRGLVFNLAATTLRSWASTPSLISMVLH